jgi:hypothetical protein
MGDMPATNKWRDAKANVVHLFKEWLDVFTGDALVDKIIYDRVTVLQGESPKYDPYQIEALLSSASALLDRCLAYRREMYDLEEKAVNRALEYKLFLDQYDALLSIELADKVESQRIKELAGQQAAAAKFGAVRDQGQGLASGFEEIAKASALSSQEAIDLEKERKVNVHTKWESLKNHQLALQERHSVPGHALNYGDRFKRLRGYLEQDIGIAYQKIRCIEVAARELFGINNQLDKPCSFGYLDTLVVYVREIIRVVELATLDEVEFEHVVSIRSPRLIQTGVYRHFDDPSFGSIMNTGDGLFSVDLRGEFPAGIIHMRLQGIGVSINCDLAGSPMTRLRTASVVVFPPPVKDLFTGDPRGATRSPVVFERVGPMEPGVVSYNTSPSIINIDPRRENWDIQVGISMLFPDDAAVTHRRNATNILDIKLHLKLLVMMDKDRRSWSNFSV